MANFNSSSWYQITVGATSTNKGLGLVGTGLYGGGGTGAAFMTPANTSDPQQLWQLFPWNSTYYVLRSKAGGWGAYLGTKLSGLETATGSTAPNMKNSTLSDDSAFWTINPWHDGTFFFQNAANGTNYNMQVTTKALLTMTTNITGPQPEESFLFTEVSTIQNEKFTNVTLPFASTTATASISPTSSPSASSSPSGLSTGAKAGIGAGVAVLALILLFALGFFLFRRRKRGANAVQEPAEQKYPPIETQHTGTTAHEAPTEYNDQKTYQNDYSRVPEMDAHQAPVEMPLHQNEPAEMDANTLYTELPVFSPRGWEAGSEAVKK